MSAIDDYTCPICMSIFIEPVVMPCYHEICMPCFKENVEKSNLCCPLCRMRISSWARKATRNNTLINERRWREVRNLFPDKVQRRLNGEEDDDDDTNEFPVQLPMVRLAEPGELKQEYEREMEKAREQREKEQRREREASEALIMQLQKEDEMERAKSEQYMSDIMKKDEELAKELNDVMNEAGVDSPMAFLIGESQKRITTRSDSTSSTVSSGRPRSGPLEKFLTNISHGGSPSSDSLQRSASVSSDRRYSTSLFESMQLSETNSKSSSCGLDADVHHSLQNLQVSRTSSSNSNKTEDSITREISHFKPIETCPKTPPKRLANGKSLEPPLIRTTPINLSRAGFESPNEKSLSDIDASSPIMQRRLSELAEERKQHVKEFSKSTSTISQLKDCSHEGTAKEITQTETKPIIGFKSENLILPYEVDLDNSTDGSQGSGRSNDHTPKQRKKLSKRVSICEKPTGLRSPDIKDWIMGRFVRHDVDNVGKPVSLDCNDNDVLITDESGDHNTTKQKQIKMCSKNSSTKENTMHNYFQSFDNSVKPKSHKRKLVNANENETVESDVPCLFRKRNKCLINNDDHVNSGKELSFINKQEVSVGLVDLCTSNLKDNRSVNVRTDGGNTIEDFSSFEDQEEKDRQLALELQEQFKFEMKYGVNADRLKGGVNMYSFRNKPKYK